jgi:uncharacterized membrane protein YdbT with pleckstrin-like domain
MWYYALSGLLTGPLYPITLGVLFFRYHTLWYRFDSDGVRMGWGILFRREVSLAYARIQDIHLGSNLVERWFGLARIQVSTASGSATAEMTIEGLPEYELVRDFLYSRMRGAAAPAARPAAGTQDPRSDELVAALRQVSEDLRAVRTALEGRSAR